MSKTFFFVARTVDYAPDPEEPGVTYKAPGIGPLRKDLQPAGEMLWGWQRGPNRAAVVKRIAKVSNGPPKTWLFTLAVINPATRILFRDQVGASDFYNQTQMLAEGALRALLDGANVKRVRRKIGQVVEGYISPVILCGRRAFDDSVPDGEDPDDFEEDD